MHALSAFRNACGGLFQEPALAFEPEQAGVMHEAVEWWRDDDDVAEQLVPVVDRAVRGDDGRALWRSGSFPDRAGR